MSAARAILANVHFPPDTSALAPCDDFETACAVERVRERLLRRRRGLAQGRSTAPAAEMDRVIAGLRRLQNPQMVAYRRAGSIILSEPFNGLKSVIAPAPVARARELIGAMLGGAPPPELVRVLAAYGAAALQAAVQGGIRIALLPDGQPFSGASPALARCAPHVDSWPAPPTGFFVVEERYMLLRTRALSMSAAHEFAHALDAVLAKRKRSYFSFESEELRFYFSTATGYVNEYAASGLDEYFAESVRAYVEINDAHCAWLPLTRQDLFLRDPRMFGLVERLFADGFASPERRRSRR